MSKSFQIEEMEDSNVISEYANPSFNPKEAALDFFRKETVDQYKGFSHQLEQTKVSSGMQVCDFIAQYRDNSEGECF